MGIPLFILCHTWQELCRGLCTWIVNGLFTYFSSFQSIHDPLCKFATCLQRPTLTIYDKVFANGHTCKVVFGYWNLFIMRYEVWVVKFLGLPPPPPSRQIPFSPHKGPPRLSKSLETDTPLLVAYGHQWVEAMSGYV
jgi:hypothetical protein